MKFVNSLPIYNNEYFSKKYESVLVILLIYWEKQIRKCFSKSWSTDGGTQIKLFATVSVDTFNCHIDKTKL